MKYVRLLLIIGLMFCQPLSSFAETDDPEVIKTRAETDATRDVSRLKWFGRGAGLAGLSLCGGTTLLVIAALSESSSGAAGGAFISYVIPPAGLIAIYRHSPSPPAEKLLGKSPLYISIYTDTYQSKARWIRTKMAASGCGLIYGVLGIWAMASLELY